MCPGLFWTVGFHIASNTEALVGIHAHTQAIGTFLLTKIYTFARTWVTYSPNWIKSNPQDKPTVTSDQRPGNFAWSQKPPPFMNDPLKRRRASDYNRAISAVTKNEPYRVHSRSSDYAASAAIYRDTIVEQSLLGKYHNLDDFTPNGSYMDNCVNESVVKAYSKLAAGKAQLGADLAEARETLGMIAKIAEQLAKAMISARRGHWRQVPIDLDVWHNGRFRGKSISERWLELQYGWKPLYGSLYDSANAYKNALNRDLFAYGRGTGKATETSSFNWKESKQSFIVENRCSTVLYGSVDRDTLRWVNQLGITNPASVAWEVVPFSFAIDWFMPIGPILETWTATLGLKDGGGFSSKRRLLKADIRYNKDLSGDWEHTPSGAFKRTLSEGQLAYEHFDFVRTAYTNWPNAGVYANLQPFKSLTRCGNALALLTQLL